ncbi:unnamed protein product [Closterium sp. NIES-64]|nr:unnamed protein product [Closterium sp. NIES-64]
MVEAQGTQVEGTRKQQRAEVAQTEAIVVRAGESGLFLTGMRVVVGGSSNSVVNKVEDNVRRAGGTVLPAYDPSCSLVIVDDLTMVTPLATGLWCVPFLCHLHPCRAALTCLFSPAEHSMRENSERARAESVREQKSAWEGRARGRAERVGGQRAWEGRERGRAESAGGQRAWEGRERGRAESLGGQRALEGRERGRAESVGGQRAWEGREPGRAESLGGQRAWEGRERGRAESVGGQRAWEGRERGRAESVGGQRAWEGRERGRAESVGGQRAWEGRERGRAESDTKEDELCVRAESDGKVVVTARWLTHCLRHSRILPLSSVCCRLPASARAASPHAVQMCHSRCLAPGAVVLHRPMRFKCAVPGAQRLLLSVTGYSGSLRRDVETMAKLIGAGFSGKLNTAVCTHLVCYELKGMKYDVARRHHLRIVNHMWLEDCLREWRLVPEERYSASSSFSPSLSPAHLFPPSLPGPAAVQEAIPLLAFLCPFFSTVPILF